MFNIFKKTMFNVTDGELSIHELFENGEEETTFVEILEAVDQTKEQIVQEPNQGAEEQLPSELEALEIEEQTLLAEKSDLTNTEEMLRQRIREAIESKKRTIDHLKREIPDLKQRCELLAKALDTLLQRQPTDLNA